MPSTSTPRPGAPRHAASAGGPAGFDEWGSWEEQYRIDSIESIRPRVRGRGTAPSPTPITAEEPPLSATPALTSTPTIPRERVTRARTAVFLTFTLAGLVFASWASRIADAKESLGLTAGQLGLTLVAASLGSVTGLPLAGRISDRIGATRAVGLGMAVGLAGLLTVGVV